MLCASQALSARSLRVWVQQFPSRCHCHGTAVLPTGTFTGHSGRGRQQVWVAACVLPSLHQENSGLSPWCSSQHRIWGKVINTSAADGVCHTFFNSGETKGTKQFWKTLLLLWLLVLQVTPSFCEREVWDRKGNSLYRYSKFCLLAVLSAS